MYYNYELNNVSVPVQNAIVELTLPSTLHVNEQGRIALRFSPETKSVRVLFRCNTSALWISGDGKDIKGSNSAEYAFEFQFSHAGDSRERDLQICIRGKLDNKSQEPLEVFCAEGNRKKPVLVRTAMIELCPKLQSRLSRIRTAVLGEKITLASVAAALAGIAAIYTPATNVVRPYVHRAAISAGFAKDDLSPFFWQYSGRDEAKGWIAPNDWVPERIRAGNALLPAMRVSGTKPGFLGALGNATLLNFTATMRIRNPISAKSSTGAGWIVYSQAQPDFAYRFWLERARVPGSAGKSYGKIQGRVRYREWPWQPALEEDLGALEIMLDLSDCCTTADVFTIVVEASPGSFKYSLCRFNSEKQLGALGTSFPLGVLRDRRTRYGSGNFGFFVPEGGESFYLEEFEVKSEPARIPDRTTSGGAVKGNEADAGKKTN